MDEFTRLSLILNDEQLNNIEQATVMVVGIGGVGAMACEALVRSGIKKIIMIDNDCVQITNINRQVHANHETIGIAKVDVMSARIKTINPKCEVVTYQLFLSNETITAIDWDVDYVIDAIDTISNKLDLIAHCHSEKIPIISSLGMGNRMDPSRLIYTKLSKTDTDPLAKAMRLQARKRNIDYPIDVVFSLEQPLSVIREPDNEDLKNNRTPPGSSAFVPNAAGLMCAFYVIRNIMNKKKI